MLEDDQDEMMVAADEVSVLIVDDHFVVRSGIAASLELDDSIKVVGEVERGEDAVAAYQQHRPRVVLMDLQLPGIGGIAATAALIKHDSAARVHNTSARSSVSAVVSTESARARRASALAMGPSTMRTPASDVARRASIVRSPPLRAVTSSA